MTAFAYRGGVLHAEAVCLEDIAGDVGTPVYVYSQTAIERAYRSLADSIDARICYAVKANSNQAVIATLARLGAGADVVSGGELARAIAAGVPPGEIVFSGVGKTREEIARAIALGVGQINVESEPELRAVSELACAAARSAVVGVRVNPDVDVNTHRKIATGGRLHKFGIPYQDVARLYAQAHGLPGLRVAGLAVHIGSQLLDPAPFERAYRRLAGLVSALRADGFSVEKLDLGGGLGIAYTAERALDPTVLADVVARTLGGLGCALVVEPGRYLVGNAGILLTRVILTKRTPGRTFVVVDAAMNDLLRPTLYDAVHPVMGVRRAPPDARRAAADIVGPVCETGDVLATAVELPSLAAGDLLAIGGAGAYGAVMASSYNGRALVGETMVCEDRFAVIRPRLDPAELLALDRLPPWLSGPKAG